MIRLFHFAIVGLCLLSACRDDEPSQITPFSTSTKMISPRVLVLTPEQYAYGGGTVIEQVIEAAGGTNAAHELNDYAQIADWQILELNPDVILFSSTWTQEQIDHWIKADVYAEIPAIQNDHYYQIDFSLADNPLMENFDERVVTLSEIFIQP